MRVKTNLFFLPLILHGTNALPGMKSTKGTAEL